MANQSWTVGKVCITSIFEKMIEPEILVDVVPALTPDALAGIDWLRPHYADAEGRPTGTVQAFVIEAPNRLIVVDTCVGNDKDLDFLAPVWSRLQTGFLDSLAKAGFDRNRVDIVVCTHLHTDHIGWNTMRMDGYWVPTFPNARYLFGREEIRTTDFLLPPQGDAAPQYQPPYLESIKPIFDAGLAQLVEADHKLDTGIHLVPTPGHTLGHVSVAIESEGQTALITGDWLHHPAQIARPEWGSRYDAEPSLAVQTRSQMLSRIAADGTLMIGTHFAEPTGGYVKGEKDRYRFDSRART